MVALFYIWYLYTPSKLRSLFLGSCAQDFAALPILRCEETVKLDKMAPHPWLVYADGRYQVDPLFEHVSFLINLAAFS